MTPDTDPRHDGWLDANLTPTASLFLAQARESWRAAPSARRQSLKAEIETLECWLAAAVAGHVPIDAPVMTELLDRHRAVVGQAWCSTIGLRDYALLADVFEAHPDFTARCEARAAGFTTWLTDAMRKYAIRMATRCDGGVGDWAGAPPRPTRVSMEPCEMNDATKPTASEIVRQWIMVFNAADPDGLAALYHPDAVNHQVVFAPVEGREAIREMFRREFAGAVMVCIPEALHEAGGYYGANPPPVTEANPPPVMA